MKTFQLKLKSSLSLLVFISLPVIATPVAQVTKISGNVFSVSPSGETRTLKLNDHIDKHSEVMVDEKGSVTLNDYYDATYHLAGGTHVKLFDKSMQLKKGKSWIQSLNARHPLALTTANGHVNYWKGEFITTFDQASSRSQVLVVNGDVEVSNVLNREHKYSVPAGSFSLIDPEVENGVPRAPTKVGLASLESAIAEFKQLPVGAPAERSAARGIASVAATPVKKGEIIFIRGQRHRTPASVKGSAHRYFKQHAAPAKAPQLSSAPITFYGIHQQQTPAVKVRKPASVSPSQMPKMTPSTWKIDPEFESSLKIKQAEQPKRPKELDNLIEDLRSY